MMALQGLSLSQPRMRADTHDGPEQIAPLQRSDTLMQLSRSLSWKSILYRTAGPYILAHSDAATQHFGRFRSEAARYRRMERCQQLGWTGYRPCDLDIH